MEEEPERTPFNVSVAGDSATIILERLVGIEALIHSLVPLLIDILAALQDLNDQDKEKLAERVAESHESFMLRYMYNLQQPRD